MPLRQLPNGIGRALLYPCPAGAVNARGRVSQRAGANVAEADALSRPRDTYGRSASAFSAARSDSVRKVMTATLLVRE